MIHRWMSQPASLVLTAVSALTLSSCGTGDGSDDHGKSAAAGTAATPSASRTAPEPSRSDRPQISSPAGLSYAFDWPRTGDKEKNAVLADSEQSIRAVDLAIVKQDALDPAYLHYYEGEAAAGTEKFIQNYVDQEATITGSYRFYDPRLSVREDGTASFTYCEDQGRVYVKYLRENRIRKTEVTAKSYVEYRTSLKRDSDGVWKVQGVYSKSGSAACQP
ncbi:hypothetical protein ACGFY8_05415 [Streptomyces sp. NPDC048232]|uniref:hypothetical protein n=1 Tax=Streptomyces sp. NPDC048232 TaxID=3365520 RepID=UPI00370FF778